MRSYHALSLILLLVISLTTAEATTALAGKKPTGSTAAIEKQVLNEYTELARYFRSRYWSTNSCFQSWDNTQPYFREAGKILIELNEAIDELGDKIRKEMKDKKRDPKRNSAWYDVWRHRVALGIAKINGGFTYTANSDTRMVGNCVHISSAVYAHFIDQYAGSTPVPGVDIAIYKFKNYGAGELGAHFFNVITCDGKSWIIDGWRGDGEAYGPLRYDHSINQLVPANSGVSLPGYFQKTLELYVNTQT